MAMLLGEVEAKVLVQVGDRDPVVVGTVTFPLSVNFEHGSD